MNKKRIYISGPIKDNPNYLIEFGEAFTQLQADGFTPLSTTKLPEGLPDEEYIRLDLLLIDFSDAVLFLPGSHESNGSCLERAYAKSIGTPCFDYDEYDDMKELLNYAT